MITCIDKRRVVLLTGKWYCVFRRIAVISALIQVTVSMQYFISISIISICLVVIFWGLRTYKENRELEKQQQKYKEDDDFRLYH